MKTVLHTKFGPPDELQIIDIEKPDIKDNEILVKIYATSVTSTDCNIRNYTFVTKFFMLPARLFMFGVFKPRNKKLGVEFAGVIESVGSDVKRFKVGDEVFGFTGLQFGAHAEYIAVSEDAAITIKPKEISWEKAACISLAGSTALYFIRNLANVQKNQKVLIIGASGGIGTYAVQLAKYYGAEVTGVCSSVNVEMVKSIGADYVIDYTKEDFTKNEKIYDVIFDVVHKTRFSSCKNSLSDKGIFLAAIMGFAEIVQVMTRSNSNGKKVKSGMADEKPENLDFLKDLVKKEKLDPVIGKVFTLDKIIEAFRYAESGHKKGNAVVKVY